MALSSCGTNFRLKFDIISITLTGILLMYKLAMSSNHQGHGRWCHHEPTKSFGDLDQHLLPSLSDIVAYVALVDCDTFTQQRQYLRPRLAPLLLMSLA